MLVAGGVDVVADKVSGISPDLAGRIAANTAVHAVIVEGDGSRRMPFKAPAPHEPVVPDSSTIVIPVVGLDVLGRPLAPEYVHRPEQVAELTGARLDDPVTPAMVAAVLGHPMGGAKGLPRGARLVPFLNKAEGAEALRAAREIAGILLATATAESVLIGSARRADPVSETWSRVGVVVLAAGKASRYGALKQVLPWRDGVPMAAHAADQALACPDVARVAVTLGAGGEQVRAALGERPVLAVAVDDWAQGQSYSVRAGLSALEAAAGPGGRLDAVLFLLADQPGVGPALLSALIQRHRETLAPVVAPRYHGKRGNPVLFDRATFPEFDRLQGDIGARPVLLAHQSEIAWVDWPSPEIVQDIDTERGLRPADGERRMRAVFSPKHLTRGNEILTT